MGLNNMRSLSQAVVLVFLALAQSQFAQASVTWSVLNQTDTGPGQFSIVQVGNCGIYYNKPPCNATMLQAACLSTPECVGFNTDGWLKSCVNATCGAQASHNDEVDTWFLTSAKPPVPTPVINAPNIGDWHYPDSERDEQRLPLLTISAIDTTAQTATVQWHGKLLTVHSESVLGNFTILAIYAADDATSLVVYKRSFEEWSQWVYASTAGILLALRAGIGSLASLDQPRYDWAVADASYWPLVYSGATDIIALNALNETSEPGYTTFNKYMPPSQDYALLGTPLADIKFVMCMDGRIKLSNYSLFENLNNVSAAPSGLIVFDPIARLNSQPVTFSSIKSTLLGKYHRIVATQVWDNITHSGFEQIAFGVDGTSRAEPILYVALNATQSYTYYRVDISGQAEDITAAQFYQALSTTYHSMEHILAQSPTTLNLPFVDRRQSDMALGAVVEGLTVYTDLNPNYGTGIDYWSVALNRGSSLPLTTFAVVNSLLELGYLNLAQLRIEYYFDRFIYPDGSINMSGWGNCPDANSYTGSFPDGLADYGQMMEMVVNAIRMGRNQTFIDIIMPTTLKIANHMLTSHERSKANTTSDDWRYGLIYGPAEHDTCHDPDYYVSTQVWFWRGLHEVGMLLQDSDFTFSSIDTSNSSAFLAAAELIKFKLEERLPAVSTFDNITNMPVFVSPKLQAQVAPFHSMIQDTVAEYSSFRYWTEALLADGLPRPYELAMLTYRETHQGVISGMTRWSDHLDDMPATGYGWAQLSHNRIEAFHAIQYGHMANYMSPGVFSATEQLNYLGNALHRLPLYGDGPSRERDLDFCIVSASLPALFTKWQLVFVPHDDNLVHLAKAAPQRWLQDGFGVDNALTRYGNVTYNIKAAAPNEVQAEVAIRANGNTCPDVVVRIPSSDALTGVTVNSGNMKYRGIQTNDVLFSCDCQKQGQDCTVSFSASLP
eukprot:TRINITY_DN9455_c0_g2_i1.p1 TRINITY_DN9455_c0_g2~~TRINITY_DN9455_c0_g2_i1.p1  ORF type:complete len:947 (+),score=173.20 TRINITY_DN9455_c0_g2_i1:720-3560(+)